MKRTPPSLAGRTAVVTGAASGIGKALAIAAAKRGMAVAIADVDDQGLGATEDRVRSLGAPCLTRIVDVADESALQSFAAKTANDLPPIGALFANAGILRQGSLLEMPLVDLQALFAVNVLGAIVTVQTFVSRMRATALPAHIVITGSTGTMASYPELAGYCATKHALWPIAEALRDDLAATGAPIGVSLLMPGSVSTAIFDQSDPDRAPAPDTITPDEAAERTFGGIEAGDFLILTHASFVARASARFETAITELERSVRQQAGTTAHHALDPAPA